MSIPLGIEHRTLSKSNLKRLEIACTLLYQKEILFIDEGLSSLDQTNAAHILYLIAKTGLIFTKILI
ncbi:hypothetical protein [Streptococcus cuniculi]|uniref:ATP-binding cassette domain-containing protein n=1 Tax=Streptococcus cuniculi TaxID=1432788 RepID=A0A4Y9J8P8_9STRE|nr:hypothetical protein [Streptococcus cuniculi]MBF0779165.1 hypothetical protein [Streptococcus cuniculi]TFU96891.1 hypothetical protein E4T82_10650 [Streptococcus cuniculi]